MVDLPSRLLQSPKVGLGATTAALVALATAGTSLLVSHGTGQLQPPSPVVAAPQPTPQGRTPVVVDRAPGSIALPPAHLVVTRPAVQPPVTAVQPVAPAPPVEVPPAPVTPVVPVTAPEQAPPPVAQPPAAPPPPVLGPSLSPGHRHHVHPEHPDDPGKHLGQVKH